MFLQKRIDILIVRSLEVPPLLSALTLLLVLKLDDAYFPTY